MDFNRAICILLTGCAAFIAACSCNKPSIEKASDYLAGVKIVECDNALRIPFEFTFSKPCSYSVEYWQKENPEVKGSTRTFESTDGKGKATVMFVYPETTYKYRIVINGEEGTLYSEENEFITGPILSGFPEYTVADNYPTQEIPGYIFQWQATTPGYVSFCDTDGNIVWYEVLETAARQVTYDEPTRTISMLLGFKTSQNDPYFQRWCSKIVLMDLEGNRLIDLETSPDNIDLPHHEIKRMPDGNIAILHGYPRVFDLTPIGGEANTTVYGEAITIVTPEMEKVWTWNCFDDGGLDPVNDEYLDAVVKQTDLIHSNSVSWDEKGNIYMTSNFLNELWKIDRATKKVLYRCGDYGDIALPEDGHASGLHAAEPQEEDLVLCLDNGSNIGISRAIMYKIDPASKTAEVSLSVPLPSELSSRDRSNTHFSKDKTMLFFGSTMGRANVFTDLKGNVLKVLKRTGISYRSYYYETVEY